MKRMAVLAVMGCATTLSACGGGTASQTLSAQYGVPDFGGAGSGPLSVETILQSADSLNEIANALEAGTAIGGTPTSASATMNG